jgi:hypothetical protein
MVEVTKEQTSASGGLQFRSKEKEFLRLAQRNTSNSMMAEKFCDYPLAYKSLPIHRLHRRYINTVVEAASLNNVKSISWPEATC